MQRFLEALGLFILSVVVGICTEAACSALRYPHGQFLEFFPKQFKLLMLFGARPIVTSVFLAVFVLPLTTFFKKYRLLPAFGLILVCWSAFAGAMVQGFQFGSYYYNWLNLILDFAIATGTAALCWWLTSRSRWARVSRTAQKLRP
jgi:hypothetical protein